jgi:hypothetical protein
MPVQTIVALALAVVIVAALVRALVRGRRPQEGELAPPAAPRAAVPVSPAPLEAPPITPAPRTVSVAPAPKAVSVGPAPKPSFPPAPPPPKVVESVAPPPDSRRPTPVPPDSRRATIPPRVVEALASEREIPIDLTPDPAPVLPLEPAHEPEPITAPEAAGVLEAPTPPVATPVVAPLVSPAVAPAAPPRDRASIEAEDPERKKARKLARLMVSEIKLYNEKLVTEGLAAGDLYSRLKDPIDQSVVLFERRIPEAVRAEYDYLHDELVRQLAGGDASKLGPHYENRRRG